MAFLGVPYAVATRFGYPEAVPAWTGIRDTFSPGLAAPQVPSRLEGVMGGVALRTSESDCLSLNIWTPDVTGSRPVLFWLHGGAWVSGSGGWSWYDGARLASQQDIVVVTANYRLGPLGYALSPGVGPAGRSDPDDESGDFGFADQVAALTWVAAEIAGFGGDPEAITVGGQSAGGHAAALLASSAATRDLVRRVVLQSAPLEWPLRSHEEATQVTAELVRELGLSLSEAAQLYELAPDDLLAAGGAVARRRHRFGSIVPPFRPSTSDLLPWSSPLDALERGAPDDLDVLVGATSEELRAFYDADPSVGTASKAAVVEVLDRDFGNGAAVYAAYESDEADQTPGEILTRAMGDAHFRSAAISAAESRERRGTGAFVYDFDWRDGPFGSCHCIDLPFLLGSEGAWAAAPMLDGANLEGSATARAFADAIGRFVRDGNPGWSRFSMRDPQVMRFGAADGGGCEPRTDLVKRRGLFGSHPGTSTQHMLQTKARQEQRRRRHD